MGIETGSAHSKITQTGTEAPVNRAEKPFAGIQTEMIVCKPGYSQEAVKNEPLEERLFVNPLKEAAVEDIIKLGNADEYRNSPFPKGTEYLSGIQDVKESDPTAHIEGNHHINDEGKDVVKGKDAKKVVLFSHLDTLKGFDYIGVEALAGQDNALGFAGSPAGVHDNCGIVQIPFDQRYGNIGVILLEENQIPLRISPP